MPVSAPSAILAYVGHLRPDRTWRLAAHSHPNHELIAVVRGCMRAWINGLELLAGPGDLLWYPAGQAHREQADPRTPAETFYLGLDARPAPALPLQLQDRDGFVRQVASWLFAGRNETGVDAQGKRQALLNALLAEARRLAAPAEQVMVTQLRTWLRPRLDEPLTLGDLARSQGLSRWHFVRSFRRATGRTPMMELRAMRLEQARDLLLGSSMSLEAIAIATGLGSQAAMTRWFSRHFAISPGRLRRRTAAWGEFEVESASGSRSQV